MIKVLATDIDGVLTDGKGYMLQNKMIKSICFQDVDSVEELRQQKIKLAIISGEDNEFTEFVIDKFSPEYAYVGCKDKVKAIQEIITKEKITAKQIAYIGDGKYDISAIKFAGVGISPCNAISEVKKAANHILYNNGGGGCLKEAFEYIKEYNIVPKLEDTIIDIMEDHKNVVHMIQHNAELINKIQQCVCTITNTLKQNGQILLCGNGGSAADAQHIATEFVSRFCLERKALNAEALNINNSSLTAIGNDYNFDYVFARQVEAKGKCGDILIGISTSGQSVNVLNALATAKHIGMKTIIFTGKYHELARQVADIAISVPSDCTARIQEMHIMIGHIICEYVEKLMFNK